MAAASSIGDLEQWRLLLAVCPLFESDLSWTPQGSDRRDFVVVEESADLFKANIRATKVLAAADYALSESTCAVFVQKSNLLLSTLETLVNDAIPRESESVNGYGASTSANLEHLFDYTCPYFPNGLSSCRLNHPRAPISSAGVLSL